jgi:hypothetical protein
MGTIYDAVEAVKTLIETYWATYDSDYNDVPLPGINLKGDVKDVRTRRRDEILIYLTATASRSGHDGYRDIAHDFKGRLHRIQLDIRTWQDRQRLTDMLNICNKILEVHRKAPGTGFDKITFPYGDGTDFSSEKRKSWRWVLDIGLVKEYDAVHS